MTSGVPAAKASSRCCAGFSASSESRAISAEVPVSCCFRRSRAHKAFIRRSYCPPKSCSSMNIMPASSSCSCSGRSLHEALPTWSVPQNCSNVRRLRRCLARQELRNSQRAVKCQVAAGSQGQHLLKGKYFCNLCFCLRSLTLNEHAVGRKYNGQFGEWTLEETDKQEVLGYRTGLSLAALGIQLLLQLEHSRLVWIKQLTSIDLSQLPSWRR